MYRIRLESGVSLVYIKDMLEKEIETREKAVEKVKTLLAEKEDAAGVQRNTPDSKVNGNVQALRSMRETQRKLFNEAQDALEDFLQHEWS